MKKNKFFHILLFILTFNSLNLLNASHIRGADLMYRSLGNQKYKIIAKVYRDCRGVSASNTMILSAFGGKNGSIVCSKVSIGTMTKTSIKDITNVCVDSLPCNPQNQFGTGNGLEEHIYELTVDFNVSPLNQMSTQTCPEITFSINECCRNGSITTGSAGNDFYAICMISKGNLLKCVNQQNTSPQWVNRPVAKICCNTPWYYNNDILDTFDFDSISYHLVPGFSSLPNGSIDYTAPFTYNFPMTPYCVNSTINCTPNANANPPIGFYFHQLTGDMVVTPTKCDESAVITVEQREYRKDSFGVALMVGSTRRDFQIIVDANCETNNPPRILGNSILKVIEGQKICETITINDANASATDSLYVSWDHGVKNATFTLMSQKQGQKIYEFCWQTQVGDANKIQNGFTVNAKDSRCNPILNSTRNFRVQISKPSSGLTAKLNDANFKIFPNPTNGKMKIEIPSNLNQAVLIVRNSVGQEIDRVHLGAMKIMNYELSGVSGMYVFELSSNGAVFTRKIFKN